MSVRERIEELSGELTSTERKLCTALLLDYPYAGLEPIQSLAEKTQTSAPTISRFVTKLGFRGYQEFQRSLIKELRQGHRSPVELQESRTPIHGAFFDTFLHRATTLLNESTTAISETQFERICDLVSNESSCIYIIGGRMSDSLALYLSRHLRQIRSKVFHLPPDPEIWPEYLLRMRRKDVLFIVDFRRYQNNLATLAQKAAEARKVQIVLMTDQWLSPISKQANEVMAVPIDNGTLWDSYTGALAMIEAIVTRVAEANWDKTKTRIENWDSVRLDFGDQNDNH